MKCFDCFYTLLPSNITTASFGAYSLISDNHAFIR